MFDGNVYERFFLFPVKSIITNEWRSRPPNHLILLPREALLSTCPPAAPTAGMSRCRSWSTTYSTAILWSRPA